MSALCPPGYAFDVESGTCVPMQGYSSTPAGGGGATIPDSFSNPISDYVNGTFGAGNGSGSFNPDASPSTYSPKTAQGSVQSDEKNTQDILTASAINLSFAGGDAFASGGLELPSAKDALYYAGTGYSLEQNLEKGKGLKGILQGLGYGQLANIIYGPTPASAPTGKYAPTNNVNGATQSYISSDSLTTLILIAGAAAVVYILIKRRK